MTIALVAQTTNKGVTATASVAKPAGTGTLLVLYISSGSITVSPPPGFTPIDSLIYGSSDQQLLVCGRVVDGTEGSTFSCAIPDSQYGWAINAELWSSTATSSPIDTPISDASAGYGAAPIVSIAPSITATTDGSVLCFTSGAYNNTANSITGYSTPTGFSNPKFSGIDQYASVFNASKQINHGATGTVSSTISAGSDTSGWGVVMFAILPPSSGGVTATVAATTSAATASGAGSNTSKATAAATTVAAVAAGVASNTSKATGAAVTGQAIASGTAASSATTGTVAATTSGPVAAGVSTSGNTTGAGSATTAKATAAGLARATTTGSGAATASGATAVGSASVTAIGVGAAIAPAATAQGIAGLSPSVGVGAATTASATASGQGFNGTTGQVIAFTAAAIARGRGGDPLVTEPGRTIVFPASRRTATFDFENRTATFAAERRIARFTA